MPQFQKWYLQSASYTLLLVAYWGWCQHEQQNREILTVFGLFTLCCTNPLHSALSCVSLLTIKRAEGSFLELSALCLDPLDLLDSPWTSPLLLFDPLLPLRLAWSIFSGWGILVIAVLLLFSPLAFPSLDLTLLAFAFFDLLSLWSDDFPCCGGVLLGWGGAISGCGWMVGGLILVASAVRLVCTVLLPTTTSVRWSSSVCSLAKLTNT